MNILDLSEIQIGKCARIITVGGKGDLRLRLLDMGLTPGTMIMVRKVAPMGDPVELNLRGYELSIRLDDAKSIEVEEVCPGGNCPCGKSKLR